MPAVEKHTHNQKNNKAFVQWIATLGVFLLMMQFGIQCGWFSPNLARLTSKNSSIYLTPNEASWLVSLSTIGSLVGCILALIFMELLGNRKVILIIITIFSISWVFLIIAKSALWLYISKFLTGIACSMSLSCFSIFLAEISKPEIRGTVISIAACGNPLGVIIGLIAESYLSMKISSTIYLCLCLIVMTLFLYLYDSPQYFLKSKNIKKASKSIAFYCLDRDLEMEKQESSTFIHNKDSKNIKNAFTELKLPNVRRSVLLIILLFALVDLSGVVIIRSYMEIILQVGKFNLISPKQFVIYANIISVTANFLTFKLIDIYGRKFLMILTGIGIFISLVALGTYFYLLHKNIDLQWLLITSILLHLIFFAIGYSKVPSTVLSEIFSDNIKNLAACLASFSACFFAFLTVKTYQQMVDNLGEENVFWIYAILNLIVSMVIILLLPETKGKSLDQIQNELRNKI